MAAGALGLRVEFEDWLQEFDALSQRVRAQVLPLLGTLGGRRELGLGAGGDRTLKLDSVAETILLQGMEEIAARGERFSVLSEEVGRVDLGAEFPLVLIDPVDGSLNAKQGIPASAVMLSLLTGPQLGDAKVGHVLNLATGERWQSIRGQGLRHNGTPLQALPAALPGRLELLGLESTPESLFAVQALVRASFKLRLLGTMAISLAHTASGGLSVFCSPIGARAFDMSAGILMIGEVGGTITDLDGVPLVGLKAGLDVHTTLLASADPNLHELALSTLRG